MRRLLLAAAVSLGGAAGAWYGAVYVYHAPGPLQENRDVVVPRGGLSQVSAVLRADGVIRSTWIFRVAELATSWQGPIRAGELSFPAGARLEQVLSILRFGHPVQHRVTFAEGLTAAQVAQVLARDSVLTGDDVVPAEGAVLPQTYAFERGTSRATLLARAEAALRAALAEAWADRMAGLPLQSARQALVLASIVERETGRPEERPLVARVFLNRLGLGMKLQADPTTVYGASGGLGSLGRGLGRDDLERVDSYNTYAVAALPDSPICNPGVASIEAVLHPAVSKALYFVADGSGGHVFAERLDEHARNVARLRAMGR
jgi:UPF0755 protein